jgi:deazaflavin-dependent oxidoreductase (nitroreductase family)
MPAGEEERAVAFYESALGLAHVPKPPNLAARGGCWFESGDAKIHLGVEADFRPARKAHPSLLVEDLAALVEALQAGGYPVASDEPLEGYDRVYVEDPFGNRIELMEPVEDTYEPSPWKWVVDQVGLYEATGGSEGGTLEGKPVVILTTKGRRTGNIRKTPLMRIEHDGSYGVVASMGGAPKHPVWYHNVVADPSVTLQDGPLVRRMRAHEADGDEKALWWARAVEAWPPYDEYQARTERVIPLIVLEPAGD